MKRVLTFTLISIFLHSLVLASEAEAGCNNLRFDDFDSSINLSSDSFPTVTFKVRRSGNGGCNFFVACGNGGASNFSTRRLVRSSGGQTVPVQICLDGSCTNICKQVTEASSVNDLIVGSFPSGSSSPSTITVTYRPKIGTTDYPRFGNYDDDFVFRLYEGSFGGSYSQEDNASVDINYTVSKAIALSIVDTGAPFDANAVNKTLNLGALTTGKTGTVDFVVKYNAGYRIRLRTDNGGMLKRSGGTELLSYTLSLNGSPVTLSTTNQTVASGSGASPAGGARFAALVTMGTVGPSAVAGTYQDNLTITVQTTE